MGLEGTKAVKTSLLGCFTKVERIRLKTEFFIEFELKSPKGVAQPFEKNIFARENQPKLKGNLMPKNQKPKSR